MISNVLACPHCGRALTLSDTGASCENRHAFDRGRGGSLHLLVGGRLPATTTPGDTPDALAARRRFLGAGHYAPIADAVRDALGDALGDPLDAASGPLLDVGCGEGWYLSQMAATERYGLDIAKRAVQMATRVLPDAQFVVANASHLPVLDHSVAAVMSVFSPRPFGEFARVLRTGGRWVTATPGRDHLRELRPPVTGDTNPRSLERFERRSRPPEQATKATRLQYELVLSPAAVADLYFMTPLQWQAGATGSRVSTDRTVTVDVWIATSSVAHSSSHRR